MPLSLSTQNIYAVCDLMMGVLTTKVLCVCVPSSLVPTMRVSVPIVTLLRDLHLDMQLTHIKIGEFPGKVLLPSKLFKSRGNVGSKQPLC